MPDGLSSERRPPRMVRQQPTYQCGSREDNRKVCAVAMADHISGAIDRLVCRTMRSDSETSDHVINDRIAYARVFHEF